MRAQSRLLVQKRARSRAGIDIGMAIVKFISPPSYIAPVKIRTQEICTPQGAERYDYENEKSPALPGFLTNFFFDQFISRAWRSDARAARPFGSHCSCE